MKDWRRRIVIALGGVWAIATVFSILVLYRIWLEENPLGGMRWPATFLILQIEVVLFVSLLRMRS